MSERVTGGQKLTWSFTFTMPPTCAGCELRGFPQAAKPRYQVHGIVGGRIDIVCERCGSGCEVKSDEAFAEERGIYGEEGAPDNVWLEDH